MSLNYAFAMGGMYLLPFFICSPLMLSYYLVLMSVAMSILLGSMSEWYFCVVILVFSGGMMVMVIYVTSLSSGPKLGFKEGAGLGGVYLTGLLLMNFLETNSHSPIEGVVGGVNMGLMIYILVFLLLGLFLVVQMVCKSQGALR